MTNPDDLPLLLNQLHAGICIRYRNLSEMRITVCPISGPVSVLWDGMMDIRLHPLGYTCCTPDSVSYRSRHLWRIHRFSGHPEGILSVYKKADTRDNRLLQAITGALPPTSRASRIPFSPHCRTLFARGQQPTPLSLDRLSRGKTGRRSLLPCRRDIGTAP